MTNTNTNATEARYYDPYGEFLDTYFGLLPWYPEPDEDFIYFEEDEEEELY